MHPSRGSEYPDHRGMAKTEIPVHEEVHEGLIQLTGRALYLRYRAVIPAHVDSPSKLVMKKGEGAVDAYVKVGPLDAGFIKTSEVAQ